MRSALPEITSENQPDAWCDLVFAIRQQDLLADGSMSLRALGMHKGNEVGLEVVLSSKWESFSPEVKSTMVFRKGTITYRSIGVASDALLVALDELYGTKLHPHGTRVDTLFTSIALEGNPAELAAGAVKIKLFFESEDESRYAEIFTNIDLPNKVLRICEKDQDYRPAIIRALQRE